jgi:hypothetical protein
MRCSPASVVAYLACLPNSQYRDGPLAFVPRMLKRSGRAICNTHGRHAGGLSPGQTRSKLIPTRLLTEVLWQQRLASWPLAFPATSDNRKSTVEYFGVCSLTTTRETKVTIARMTARIGNGSVGHAAISLAKSGLASRSATDWPVSAESASDSASPVPGVLSEPLPLTSLAANDSSLVPPTRQPSPGQSLAAVFFVNSPSSTRGCRRPWRWPGRASCRRPGR